MDENKEVNSTDPKREKVRVIPLSAIDDAPDHPFGVRDDEEMAELVESISTFGVINPVIVRKGEGERYELISGHRRKYACAKLGIETLPVIVRDLSREEAIIFMVDSNLHREHILPSERAKAYQMKMEALKKRAGSLRPQSFCSNAGYGKPVSSQLGGEYYADLCTEPKGYTCFSSTNILQTFSLPFGSVCVSTELSSRE